MSTPFVGRASPWLDRPDLTTPVTAAAITGWETELTALGTRLYLQRAGAESWHNAVDFADGPLTVVQSGQTWSTYGTSVPGVADPLAVPRYVGGRIVNAVPANGAGYFTHQLRREVTEISAGFTLSSYATLTGGAMIGCFAQDLSVTGVLVVPDSPCHLTISATGWEFLVIENNAPTSVGSGTFATPLVADGVTVHHAAIYRDRLNSKAYLALPDGTVRVVSHARIGSISARWPTWEIFRLAATDSAAAFVYTSAESLTQSRLPLAKVASLQPPLTSGTEYSPASLQSYALTASNQVFNASYAVTFTYPTSGRVLISAEVYLAMTGAGLVALSLNQGAVNIGLFIVANEVANGRRGFSRVVNGTPGAVATLSIGGVCFTPAVATVEIWEAGGKPAMVIAQPL